MSDFDFNVKFIGEKTQLGDHKKNSFDESSNPGSILESKYIGKNKVNEIVLIKQSQPIKEVHYEEKLDELKNAQSKGVTTKYKVNQFSSLIQSFASSLLQPQVWYKSSLYVIIFAALIVTTLVTSLLINKPSTTNAQNGQVAGINETKENKPNEPTDAYKEWIAYNLGQYVAPDEDTDGDQLTNEEEFIIGTDPNNSYTCNPNKTDAENLVEFINPITCKSIDVNDQVAMDKFSKIIDFESVHNKVIQNNIVNDNSETNEKNIESNSVQKIFGTSSLQSLNKQSFDESKLKSELDSIKIKQTYISKINRINQYMKQTRSLEPFDRNYPLPVNGAVYLDVSIRYNVPIKYVLALAQRESRFGTDAYDKKGNLTRPGKYKNIFSIGLDDSGNNLGFDTWEDGVEAFGKWYKRFEDRGVPDCAKWRIYNPNGDYCQRVEETASQIDFFLNKN